MPKQPTQPTRPSQITQATHSTHLRQPTPAPSFAPLPTIDPTALAHVSGGARASSASGGGGSGGGGGGSGDAAVMSALTGILDSLRDLAGQRRQSGFGPQEMMMFMMMLQQRSSSVVVQPASSLPVIYTDGTNRVF